MQKNKSTANNYWQLIIGIGISIVSIFILLQFVDLSQVMDALRLAKLEFVLLAAIIYVLPFLFRSLAWQIVSLIALVAAFYLGSEYQQANHAILYYSITFSVLLCTYLGLVFYYACHSQETSSARGKDHLAASRSAA